jgi:uncharacterized protein YodC (DUF2158 family)
MRYSTLPGQKFRVGGTAVEAACETPVAQPVKCSGRRWLCSGGQAILTLLGMIRSNWWKRAWPLLREVFKGSVLVTYQPGFRGPRTLSSARGLTAA